LFFPGSVASVVGGGGGGGGARCCENVVRVLGVALLFRFFKILGRALPFLTGRSLDLEDRVGLTVDPFA
jgi:hypothetical protein